MSSRNYSRSRRDFLKIAANSAISAVGMTLLPFPKGSFSSIAKATTKGKRQHLINVIDLFGWDTAWWYNHFDPNLNSVIFDAATDSMPPAFNNIRYASSAYTTFAGQKMAPGMKFFTPTDLSHMAIWKGANAISGHGQNAFFLAGGETPYDASYSSLLSAYQADTRGQSLLHYVKISSNVQDFFTMPGTMTGVAVPTCIPTQGTWSSLTSAAKNPSMLTSDGVDRAIASLAAASAAQLNRTASTGIVSGFSSGFSNANTLSASNYGSSDAFLQIWLRYFKAMKQEAVDQTTSGYGSSAVGGSFQSDIATALAPLVAFPISTTADLTTGASGVVSNARTIAWNFAMATFLVINDLSAVVDFHPSGLDSHQSVAPEYMARIWGMTGFRELIRHLSSVANPEGGTMLDITLLTYTSEFDRQSIFSTQQGNWGTSHGTTFSAILAGHMTAGGRILGSNLLGDASSVPTELRGNDAPLGVDPVTGAIGGAVQDPRSLLPTVMQMFGAPIPPQQLTQYLAIPYLIKS